MLAAASAATMTVRPVTMSNGVFIAMLLVVAKPILRFSDWSIADGCDLLDDGLEDTFVQ
jgi:hypothetical protein